MDSRQPTLRERIAATAAVVSAQSERCARLRAQSLAVRNRSLALRLQAADARAAATGGRPAASRRPSSAWPPPSTPGPSGVRGFELRGELGNREVWARLEDGRLAVDDRLATHARLLVDLGEAFEVEPDRPPLPATLDGPSEHVLVTLMRACDRLFDVTVQVAAV